MSDNVTPFPVKEDTVTTSLETYVSNISELVKNKNVKSILTIMYTNDEEGDEPTLYLAGEYIKPKEIIGDIEIIKDFILNDF